MINKTISHYKILEKLGEGGMGIVYKALDTKLDRIVALKFLPPHLSINKEEKKRFIHEAKAAASLDHPNICTVHEIGETEDCQMFIAMGYYEGETLKDKIASGPLPVADSINIAIQIAEGLNAAHKKEIVHRDIKSANIIITSEGTAKILDFGLAKLKGQTKLTKEGSTLGTIDYMSPEQATGDKVDQRTDIWSLGVIFYEMLTGQLPFKGQYEQAVIYSIINQDPDHVTALRTGITMELERIIDKTLAKDPGERYLGTADLLVDLKEIKKDSSPGITPVRRKTKPETIFEIPRRIMMPGSFVLIALMVIAGYYIFKGRSGSETPKFEPGKQLSLAVVYFENKSGDEKLDYWRDAFSELLTTDLAQSRYIKVLRSDEIYGIFKKLNLLEARRYSTEDLKKIAKNGRINHILNGSYVKAGDIFVITAVLFNAISGQTICSLSVRAETKKDIIPKVDELTRRIKSELDLTDDQIAGDIDLEIGKITTSSPEALKYYFEGRKYFYLYEWRKSITSMEKAIKIDPEFAMAYRSMARSYTKLGYPIESDKYTAKAMELSDRLPDREKYIIRGDFYKLKYKEQDKAIEAYKKVLQLYPLDEIANIQLADIYDKQGEFDKAIERMEVLVRNKNENWDTYGKLSYYYQSKGLNEKARELLEYFLENFQNHPRVDAKIRSRLSSIYYKLGKFDLAFAEIDKAIALAPEASIIRNYKGWFYFYKGDFSSAEKIFRKIIKSKEITTRIQYLSFIIMGYITQGRFAEAETGFRKNVKMSKEFERKASQLFQEYNEGIFYFYIGKYDKCIKRLNDTLILKYSTQGYLWKLYYIAVSYLEKNLPDQARKVGDELLEFSKNNKSNKRLIRYYYLFKGKEELKKKNFSKAIEYMKKSVSFLPYQRGDLYHHHAVYFDGLAQAYLRSGDLEKAREEYENVTVLTVGRDWAGDTYAKAFYQLGKIYQQKEQKEKAIENYNKFIELWKNCDPEFQYMVKDARDHVKKLEEKI